MNENVPGVIELIQFRLPKSGGIRQWSSLDSTTREIREQTDIFWRSRIVRLASSRTSGVDLAREVSSTAAHNSPYNQVVPIKVKYT